MQPLVSVIIPAFNAEQFLPDCLKTIFEQSYKHIEIIVVDDGSTDGTAAQVAQFGERIKYVYQENRGPAAARNTGFKLAKGTFWTTMDADDLCPLDRIAGQLDAFECNPDADVVLGKTRLFRESPETRAAFASASPEILKKLELPRFSLPFSGYFLPASMWRSRVAQKVGLLSEELWLGEDTEWFLRARERQVVLVLTDQTVLYYRRHPTSLTADRRGLPDSLLHTVKNSLDRRRRDGEKEVALAPHAFHTQKGTAP